MSRFKKIVFALPFVLVSITAHADFDDGKKAYNSRDWKAAILNLRPLVEQNDARAAMLLGNMYNEGYGVDQDKFEAFKLYRQAAVAGDPEAMLMVAVAYQKGTGVDPDIVKADGWYKRAAMLGNQLGAFFHATAMYEGSRGGTVELPPNHLEAYQWFKISTYLGTSMKFKRTAGELATELAKKLPPFDVAAANKTADDFKPSKLEDLGPPPDIDSAEAP